MHIPGEKVHNSRELQKQKLLLVSVRVSITYSTVGSLNMICNIDAEFRKNLWKREIKANMVY